MSMEAGGGGYGTNKHNSTKQSGNAASPIDPTSPWDHVLGITDEIRTQSVDCTHTGFFA